MTGQLLAAVVECCLLSRILILASVDAVYICSLYIKYAVVTIEASG
jgi:hypothetical protein